MGNAVLTLNAGSSSLKFALFRRNRDAVLRGEVEDIGTQPKLTATGADGERLATPHVSGDTHEAVLAPLLHWVGEHLGSDTIAGVGHRIVHGGDDFADPVRLDAAALAKLEALVPLAPLHQPHNLAAIRAVARLRPELVQVGSFDTAFHRTLPAIARAMPLPPELGLRRYGFHGLSYTYIAGRLAELSPELASGRVVVAHLGSGASLCAMRAGSSIETTMGFSVLDGLVMGTRPGRLDPGVIIYLQKTRSMSVDAVEDLLYHHAGLLGVSGVSSDMRKLAASRSPAAQAATDLFAYRIAAETGAMVSALGGIDGFVFTGGIGAHDPALRLAVAERLAWLGVELDPARNATISGRISDRTSRVAVWVIPTDEETVIAAGTWAFVA